VRISPGTRKAVRRQSGKVSINYYPKSEKPGSRGLMFMMPTAAEISAL